jgi:CDP-diacylglycerol--glycerol-3-phosphate 3-phosphatidyltransferase
MLYALPNLLTYARIICIPALVFCMYLNTPNMRLCAFIIFVLAGISDFFDGWLARKWNMQSALGKMLDPIADKLLIAALLIMLVYVKDIKNFHVFSAIIILCREILVSGLREYLSAVSVSLPVTRLAKWKTAFQIISLGILIIAPSIDNKEQMLYFIGIVFLWISAILTLYTGYDYCKSGIAYAVKNS